MLNYIQCPTCETLISWRVIYANNERSAHASIEQKHHMRCLFCQCVFTYRPSKVTTRRWWQIQSTTSIVITDLTVVSKGHVG